MDVNATRAAASRVAAPVIVIALLVQPCLAQAQNPPPGSSTFGAFADLSYLFAPNQPVDGVFRGRGTAWHVNDLFVNMAGVYARRPSTADHRWGGEVTLHTGKDDEIFGFSATAPNIDGAGWLRHLGPTNVSYLAGVGEGLSIQAGIFSSLIGYDSLYARDNLTYTRPWGADYTPYLMLGVNAAYPITARLTGTALIVNSYWHLANANAVPSIGGQLAYAATPRVAIKQTVMAGPHQESTAFEHWRWLSDTIVERRVGRVVVAFNGHVATERVAQDNRERAWWIAAQLPAQWHVDGPWRLAIRPEIAWDSSGRWTLAEQRVTALTSTLEYRALMKSAGASVRLEHRVDRSTGRQGGFFTARRGELTPTQHLVILAVIIRADGVNRP